MKKLIIPFFLFMIIGLLIFLNYLFPLISLFEPIKYDPGIYKYVGVILSYGCIVLLVLTEYKNLEEFHLDRLSLAIVILVAGVRGQFNIPGEIYFKVPIAILGLGLLFGFIKNYRKIPKTKSRWAFIGLLSCLLIIPLAFIGSLQPGIHSNPRLLADGFLLETARNFLYNLDFVAPFEEIIFRGVLWGYLRRWGWNEKRIFWSQAILFWLLHIYEVSTMPIIFLTILPISILIDSVLVRYSKQVFPSIIFHSAFDSLVLLLIQFYIN